MRPFAKTFPFTVKGKLELKLAFSLLHHQHHQHHHDHNRYKSSAETVSELIQKPLPFDRKDLRLSRRYRSSQKHHHHDYVFLCNCDGDGVGNEYPHYDDGEVHDVNLDDNWCILMIMILMMMMMMMMIMDTLIHKTTYFFQEIFVRERAREKDEGL